MVRTRSRAPEAAGAAAGAVQGPPPARTAGGAAGAGTAGVANVPPPTVTGDVAAWTYRVDTTVRVRTWLEDHGTRRRGLRGGDCSS